MDKTEKLTIDKYRLTLTHELIIGDVIVKVEEPKILEMVSIDGMRNDKEYENHLLDELFRRFRKELKEQNNDKN